MSHYATNLPNGVAADDLPNWRELEWNTRMEFEADLKEQKWRKTRCIMFDEGCSEEFHDLADGLCLEHGIMTATEQLRDFKQGSKSHLDCCSWLDSMLAARDKRNDFIAKREQRKGSAA